MVSKAEKFEIKRKLVVGDTEDNSRDREKNPHLETKMTIGGFYDGEFYREFKNYNEFLALIPEKTPMKLFFHNAEYDVGNIFRYNLDKVEITYIKGRFISAKMKDRDVWIYDSFNHWKAGLGDMGDMMDLPKLEFDPDSFEYRKRDCDVLAKFMSNYQDMLSEYGVEIKSTIAATALEVWKDNFVSPFIYKHKLTNEDKEYYRQAYFGGRVECFRTGEIKGDVRFYDINSMYPNVMWKYRYPHLRSKIDKPDLNYMGVTTCTVESAMAIPILPYKDKEGKLLFPNGRFKGTWTNCELNYFQDQGGKIIRIHEGHHFTETVNPFSAYVEHFYRKRENAKSTPERNFYKSMMNNLYGKFAQGTDLEVLKEIDLTKPFDGIIYPQKDGKYFGAVKKDSVKTPPHANVIWACYVTAYARIELHKYLAAYSENLLYCDTDSVALLNLEIPTSPKLGDMKLEAEGKKIMVILPKLYFLFEDEYKLPEGVIKRANKGFSYSTDALLPFLWDQKFAAKRKPIRLRSALNGEIPFNTWRTQLKFIRSNYNKRKVLSDGRTEPLVINDTN